MLTLLRLVPVVSSIFLVSLLAAGCMSRKDGEALQRDVTTLQRKLAAMRQQMEAESLKLQKVLGKTTTSLSRNSADIGAQVDRLERKVTKLSGKMDETRKDLADLSKKYSDFQAKVDVKLERLTSGAPKTRQAPVPQDKDKLFVLAKATITRGKHGEGRRLLRHFLARFPKDARASLAQVLLGNSYFAQGKYANAIQEYRKVLEQHKRSKQVPDALYKIGLSFYQLKFCTDARTFLSELLRKYRRYRKARNARKVLRVIRRFRKNPRYCSS